MVLAILGLCVRGPTSTCPSKDACCRSQSAICPQTKSSPLESSPGWVFRKGQSWAWPQEAVVITLADCERKTDRLWILRVIRRTNTHLSGSLTLPGQRNLHHFGVIIITITAETVIIKSTTIIYFFIYSAGGTVLRADIHGHISFS